MKICYKCKLELDYTKFSKCKTKKDGYNSICKECHKLYSRKHYLVNKDMYLRKNKKNENRVRKLVDEYKSKLGCCKCNEKDYICLDFHHLSNDKEACIAVLVANGNGWNKIKKEIDKCVVICSNCHRKLHRDSKCLVSVDSDVVVL